MSQPLRWYVAGPMSGLPLLNFPAFNAAAARIRALGHEAVNPAEVNPDPNMAWAEAMKRDIPELLKCDGVVMLPGWQSSRGARIEHNLAVQLGLRVVEGVDAVPAVEGVAV